MSTNEPSYTDLAPDARVGTRGQSFDRQLARARAAMGTVKLQLAALLALAGALNLWALQRNGWANDYYSAAVRSMSTSWHDFLFASMDRAGVMTVDKPPLALWVQALSVRAFGYHPLSILVPQAMMGMASVALVYDLVRRRFGRLGGFVAGLALALTPISVAISRHNNPDALLVLCSVAAVWCAVRALESDRAERGAERGSEHGAERGAEHGAVRGSERGAEHGAEHVTERGAERSSRRATRWLVLAGVCVGLGFETKMGVALMVVPGIVAAYLWVAPRGRLRALGTLGLGGLAALVVGGAWPLLVELTPAGQRPWVSGTKGDSIWELITEYNGLGRLEGQTGGPAGVGGGGGAGNTFGGGTGFLRLLNAALGGQAGWLLGFALLSGVAILLASRLRRGDPRSGWLIAVGGSFLVVAVVFSEARGIFHPYYVSLLAPFAAALTGAGIVQLRGGDRLARVLAPAAIVAGVACELAVLNDYPGELRWLVPVLVVVGAGAAIALVLLRDRAARIAALGCGVAALLIAPGIWAVDTLGYATNGTFPSGGPQSALTGGGGGPGGPGGRFGGRFGGGGPGGGGGGPGGSSFGPGARGFGGAPGGASVGAQGGARGAAGVPLFGPAGARASGGSGEVGVPVGPGVSGAPGGSGAPAGLGGGGGAGAPTGSGGFAGPAGPGGAGEQGGGGGAIGAPLGNAATIGEAIAYAKSHGGGTVAVDSQSQAASEIVASDAEVAGIGGFSGRESEVSIAWLAGEVAKGAIRWVLSEGGTQSGPPAGALSGSRTGASTRLRGPGGGGLPGDTRQGAKKAIAAASEVCRKVTLASGSQQTAGGSGRFAGAGLGAGAGLDAGAGGGEAALYDCAGKASALLRAGS